MVDKNGFELSDSDLTRELGGSTQVIGAFSDELARMRQAMFLAERDVSSLASGIGGGLRRAFDGVVLDGMRLSDALGGVARSKADTMFSMAMKPINDAVSGALAQGINGMMSGALPFANGGAFSQGRVMPFARGGVVSSPTHFPMRGGTGLMGEAGPEAIMPLRRGAEGRLGVATEGGARSVNVTMNISTPDVTGFQRSQSQIAAQLGRALSRGDRNY